MTTPNQTPDSGGGLSSGASNSRAVSGTSADADPTNEPGQYPVGDWGTSIFGGPLPDGTGAPGTAGYGRGASGDPTNEPGQTSDGLTGLTEDQITNSGAPGTTGAQSREGGGPAISYTLPGSYLSGTYQSETMNDPTSGPQDETQANDQGYASGGPKLPGMQEPAAGTGSFQPGGGGKVLRGGRAVRG